MRQNSINKGEVMIYHRDHKQAFRDALKTGALTKSTIKDYMYMGTDSVKGDGFKHIQTRKYIFNQECDGK